MRYLLDRFGSIPHEALERLCQAGISDTDQLLQACTLPKDRKALSSRLNLQENQLVTWAGMADLVRVKGIGPAFAELLVTSGVAGNVQSVAAFQHNPVLIKQKLDTYVEEKGRTVYVPNEARLLSMAEEAAELRPKLLLNMPEEDNSFSAFVFSRKKEEQTHARKLSFSFIAILVIVVWILYGLNQLYLNRMLAARVVPGDSLNAIAVDIAHIMIHLSSTSLLWIMGMLVLFLTVLFFLYDLLSHVQDTWLIIWLFNRPAHQRFYRLLKSINLTKQVRGIWWAMGVFGLLVIILIIVAYQMLRQEASLAMFIQRLSVPIIIGGVLFGLITSLPILRFYFKNFNGKEHQDSVQRYMVYYFSKILILPLMVVLLTMVIMPLSFRLHHTIILASLVPSTRESLLIERSKLINLELKTPEDDAKRIKIIKALDEEILSNLDSVATVSSEQDTIIVERYIPAALNMVVWTALTAFALLFVLPYLILGGWRRGLFYILVLGISFYAENLLSIYSPVWFRLPVHSASSFLMIAFFVFANALFFDWLFDTFSERKKACPSCDANLSLDDFFCPSCGFVQK
jgi:hypothetical protein